MAVYKKKEMLSTISPDVASRHWLLKKPHNTGAYTPVAMAHE
jgi:hypothetical protein